MTEDEREARNQIEEDGEEDLELDEQADEVRGGQAPIKWPDAQLKYK